LARVEQRSIDGVLINLLFAQIGLLRNMVGRYVSV
jgi:hypothetical protein